MFPGYHAESEIPGDYCPVWVCSVAGFGETEPDRDAIRRAVLNYAEGWYEGNAEKMESALHPDLGKGIVRTNERGQSRIYPMSALAFVQGTRSGFGKQTPKEEQQKDVTILDVIGGAAAVKLRSVIGSTICTWER